MTFAQSLCDHPRDTLVAIHRAVENGEIRETFRTLHPRSGGSVGVEGEEIVGVVVVVVVAAEVEVVHLHFGLELHRGEALFALGGH